MLNWDMAFTSYIISAKIKEKNDHRQWQVRTGYYESTHQRGGLSMKKGRLMDPLMVCAEN